VARLSGKEAPKHPDNEKTLADFKARIVSTISYLNDFSEKDFASSAERLVTSPYWNGKHLSGEDYVLHHALPNIYFHVATAYSILRHNGVQIGKADYLGVLPFKD
jgi:hypothetical protein